MANILRIIHNTIFTNSILIKNLFFIIIKSKIANITFDKILIFYYLKIKTCFACLFISIIVACLTTWITTNS